MGLLSYTHLQPSTSNLKHKDELGGVLVRVSLAVKRHHDHSSSYVAKYLIEVAVSV